MSPPDLLAYITELHPDNTHDNPLDLSWQEGKWWIWVNVRTPDYTLELAADHRDLDKATTAVLRCLRNDRYIVPNPEPPTFRPNQVTKVSNANAIPPNGAHGRTVRRQSHLRGSRIA